LTLTCGWTADSAAGRALAESAQITAADLPAVITGHQVLRRATTEQAAQALGLAYRHTGTKPVDLIVVGSGPAASSRIENYLGFPLRSQRQGADPARGPAGDEIRCPAFQPVSGGRPRHRRSAPEGDAQRRHHHRVPRPCSSPPARITKTLPLERWIDFEGAGIYYAATETGKLTPGRTQPVTVVGGANSAGQAALFLASRSCRVTLAVRGIRRGRDDVVVSVGTATHPPA